MISRDRWKDAEDEVSADLTARSAVVHQLDRLSASARIARDQMKPRKVREIRLEPMRPISYWATIVGYDADTIRDWCKADLLDAIKIRGDWRISERAMREFLQKENSRG